MQDEPLKWGCAVRPAVGEDIASPHAYKPEGTTLKDGKQRREVPVIYEAVIIARNADGSRHIAPMGYRESGEHVVLAPFRPLTGARFDPDEPLTLPSPAQSIPIEV